METPKYRKGDCVEYPKAEEWGFGIVLEDCQDEHLRVFFSLGGYRVLPMKGLSISKVGRWPNLDFSSGKVSCPFCNRRVEDLKKHSCSPNIRKEGVFPFVGLGGKKVKYKVKPDEPMPYPYEAYRPKKNMEIPKYRKWDRVEYPQKKQWGTGTVLEDCEGKNIHVRFDRGGHKILPTEGLNLTRVGRRRYLNISTGKDRGLKKT